MTRSSLITITQLLLIFLLPQSVFAQNLDLQLLDQTPIPTISQLPNPQVNKSKISEDRVTEDPQISLKLNSDVVDFGILTPTNPIIRYSSINLTSPSTFYLTAYQNNYLSTKDNLSFIPNTSCDNGICNETTPGPWLSTLTYGLGIKCASPTANTVCLHSEENNKYSTLPLNLNNFFLAKGSKKADIEITYKINSTPSQAPGNYQNTLYFILTPSL